MSKASLRLNFLKGLENFDLSSDDIKWHQQKSTAIGATIDPQVFHDTFRERKSEIAGTFFDLKTEDNPQITLSELRDKWTQHVTKNPYFALNTTATPDPSPPRKRFIGARLPGQRHI